MSNTLCQFQSTHYLKNSDGTFTSVPCDEPSITGRGLTDTERNKQTVNYLRDQRRWKESQGENGYAAEYDECSGELGRSEGNPTKCAYTPALTAENGDGFAPLMVAGKAIQYNQYGRADAAFARIHLKEGNQETGYLKIQNPPTLFKSGGKLFDHYQHNSNAKGLRARLGGNLRGGTIHDERACSLGISQFCQTENAKQDQFKSNFHVNRQQQGNTIAAQALPVAALPGEANNTELYRKTRGYN